MSLVEQWLLWSVSCFAPTLSQNHHFRHYAPERIDYALARYDGETVRLYGALERRLSQSDWVGGDYSIADISLFGWVNLHERHGIDLAKHPHVRIWLTAMLSKPAIQSGLAMRGEANERRFTD